MISRKKIIIIAVVIIAVVAVGVYLWQFFFASFADVEGTTRNLVNKLSSHDAAGAWALTSQDFQEDWTYAEFEDTIDYLHEIEWHATIQSIDSKEIETIGDTEFATVTLTLACTDIQEGTYTETWMVGLTGTDNEWKIEGFGPED
jgi:hypothetical protein